MSIIILGYYVTSRISTHEQIYLGGSAQSNNMKNIYELYNKGPSTIQSADIVVSFPQIQDAEKAYVYLNKTEVSDLNNAKINLFMVHSNFKFEGKTSTRLFIQNSWKVLLCKTIL